MPGRGAERKRVTGGEERLSRWRDAHGSFWGRGVCVWQALGSAGAHSGLATPALGPRLLAQPPRGDPYRGPRWRGSEANGDTGHTRLQLKVGPTGPQGAMSSWLPGGGGGEGRNSRGDV